VNGETIMLDELGPIILQEDGRLGRLSNWHDMTEPEQAATLRFVAKRIAKAKADSAQGAGRGRVIALERAAARRFTRTRGAEASEGTECE